MTATKEEIVAAVLRFIRMFSFKVTLRQLYYRLVEDARIIPKTENSYKHLSKVLVEARLNGSVPMDALADLTRAPILPEEREFTPEEHFERWFNAFKGCDELYEIPRWADQPYHVEVWVEKAALQSFLQQITDELQVPLFPIRGYASFTSLKEAADRLGLVDGDKEIVILYLGDHDPSGRDIDRYVPERIRSIDPDLNIEFKRIAVTAEQIDEQELPTAPPKASDSRTAGFEDEHGGETVELEAFEPDILAAVVREAIDEYWDEDVFTEQEERQAEGRIEVKREITRSLRT